MSIETRKISFIQEFLQVQNEEIIRSLEDLLKSKKKEHVNTSKEPMSIYQLNKEIDESMKDSENGKIKKAADLKNKY
jgi:hypothetical protein